MKLKALVLPQKSRLDEVCSSRCRSLINEYFEPVWNTTGKDYTEEELGNMVADAEVILTSWGSPILSLENFKKAEKLRYIGHAAGTVKNRLPFEVFDKGVRVFSAAPRIAQSVGEYCLAALMTSLRYINTYNVTTRQGQWKIADKKGHELTGNTIGIVSASSTARAFLRYLAPFNANILIYDPFISEERAKELGCKKSTLEEVMKCPIISVHAPSLPSTVNLINKEMIKLIPDGAILINSSRGLVLDELALIEELSTGRFMAALDVFWKEPVPIDNPLLQMDNVIVTAHVAGATVEGHLALMEAVVEDMIRAIKKEPTTGFEVTAKMWDLLA